MKFRFAGLLFVCAIFFSSFANGQTVTLKETGVVSGQKYIQENVVNFTNQN